MNRIAQRTMIAGAVIGLGILTSGVANADTGSASVDPIGDAISYYTDVSASNGYRWRDDSQMDPNRVVGSFPNQWGAPYPVYSGQVFYFQKRLDCQSTRYYLETGMSGIPFMRTCSWASGANGPDEQRGWYFRV